MIKRKNSQHLNFGMLKQILLLKENIDAKKKKKKLTTQYSMKNKLKNNLLINNSSNSLVNVGKKSLSKNTINGFSFSNNNISKKKFFI